MNRQRIYNLCRLFRWHNECLTYAPSHRSKAH